MYSMYKIIYLILKTTYFRYNMMLRCWDEDPTKRPSFGQIVREISAILDPDCVPEPPKGPVDGYLHMDDPGFEEASRVEASRRSGATQPSGEAIYSNDVPPPVGGVEDYTTPVEVDNIRHSGAMGRSYDTPPRLPDNHPPPTNLPPTLPGSRPSSATRPPSLPGSRPSSGRPPSTPDSRPTSDRPPSLPGNYPSSRPPSLPGNYPSSRPPSLPGNYPSSSRPPSLPGNHPSSRPPSLPGSRPTSSRPPSLPTTSDQPPSLPPNHPPPLLKQNPPSDEPPTMQAPAPPRSSARGDQNLTLQDRLGRLRAQIA